MKAEIVCNATLEGKVVLWMKIHEKPDNLAEDAITASLFEAFGTVADAVKAFAEASGGSFTELEVEDKERQDDDDDDEYEGRLGSFQ